MRAKAVTTDEQYRLIMEYKASGMTDYQWCIAHNIHWIHCFCVNGRYHLLSLSTSNAS